MSRESQVSLSFQFWLGRPTASTIISECIEAIYQSANREIFTKFQITGGVENNCPTIWIEEEEIYFSKQKHSVQPVVCLNTIISNNKKYYITVLKNMYLHLQWYS